MLNRVSYVHQQTDEEICLFMTANVIFRLRKGLNNRGQDCCSVDAASLSKMLMREVPSKEDLNYKQRSLDLFSVLDLIVRVEEEVPCHILRFKEEYDLAINEVVKNWFNMYLLRRQNSSMFSAERSSDTFKLHESKIELSQELEEPIRDVQVAEDAEDNRNVEVVLNQLTLLEPVAPLNAGGKIQYYNYTIYAGHPYILTRKKDSQEVDIYYPLEWKQQEKEQLLSPWKDRYIPYITGDIEWRRDELLEIRIQAAVRKLTNHHTEIHYKEASYSVWSELHHAEIADSVIQQLLPSRIVVIGDGHGLLANRGVQMSSTLKVYPHTNSVVKERSIAEVLSRMKHKDNRVLVLVYVSSFLSVDDIAMIKTKELNFVEIDTRSVLGVPGYSMASNVIQGLQNEQSTLSNYYAYSRNSLQAYPMYPGKYQDYHARLALDMEKRGRYVLIEKWGMFPDYEKNSFYYAFSGRVQHGIDVLPRPGNRYSRTVYKVEDLTGLPIERVRQVVRGIKVYNYIMWPTEDVSFGVKEWHYIPTPRINNFNIFLRQERKNGNVLPISVLKEYWDGKTIVMSDAIGEPKQVNIQRKTKRLKNQF